MLITSASPSLKPPRGIPIFLLRPSLRLFFLRCLIPTLAIVLAYSNRLHHWTLAISIITMIHHCGSVLGPRIFPIFTWMDVPLTAAEVGVHIYLTYISSPWVPTDGLPWTPNAYIFPLFGLWAATLSLIGLLVIKILELIDSRGSAFKARADITREPRSRGGDGVVMGAGGKEGVEWWRYPVRVVFGKKIWERKLPGEGRWIIIVRGCFALVALASLVVYGTLETILGPLEEMGLMRTRRFETTRRSSEYLIPRSDSQWNVLMMWPKRDQFATINPLTDMVSVTPLWIPSYEGRTLPEGPACTKNQLTDLDIPDYISPSMYEIILFKCPPRPSLSSSQSSTDVWSLRDKSDPFMHPNLFLSVNFTGLVAPDEVLGDSLDAFEETLQVYLALTDDLDDILTTTRPTLLQPGERLVGMADIKIRQRLKPYQFSTLGIFDFYRTFMVADISLRTGGDSPLAMASSSANPNISTMRIAIQHPPGGLVEVIQDYRAKSVLEGLSALGGLAAVLSTLFAFLLGISLMQVVHQSKPHTPFGVLHHLENQQKSISDECDRKYSKLKSDIQALQDNPGLLAFLFDTLVDLDLLRDEYKKDRQDGEDAGVDFGRASAFPKEGRVWNSEMPTTPSGSSSLYFS